MTVESAIINGSDQLSNLETALTAIKTAIEGIECGGGEIDIATLWVDLQAHWNTLETGVVEYGVAGEPTTWELENLDIRNFLDVGGDIEASEIRPTGLIASNYITSQGTMIVSGYLEVDGEVRFDEAPLIKMPRVTIFPRDVTINVATSKDSVVSGAKSFAICVWNSDITSEGAWRITLDLQTNSIGHGGASKRQSYYRGQVLTKEPNQEWLRIQDFGTSIDSESIPGYGFGESFVIEQGFITSEDPLTFFMDELTPANVPQILETSFQLRIMGPTEDLKVAYGWGLASGANDENDFDWVYAIGGTG